MSLGITEIILILVVVILLIRRKKSERSDEGDTNDQEFAEETITTLNSEHTAEHGWSQTTEDNPLFSTENFDDGDNPFTNAFEETGFFQAS